MEPVGSLRRNIGWFILPERSVSSDECWGCPGNWRDPPVFTFRQSFAWGCPQANSRNYLQGYNAGCFKIKFQSRSMLMKICGFMSNARVKFRNIALATGNIHKQSYFYEWEAFGIPIMEDYQLSMNIKAKGDKLR